MGLFDPQARTISISDPDSVWLSVPGRKLLNGPRPTSSNV
jgi:hypothetical protein